jgi:hypothetical protein
MKNDALLTTDVYPKSRAQSKNGTRKRQLEFLFLNAVGRRALEATKAKLRELFNELIED